MAGVLHQLKIRREPVAEEPVAEELVVGELVVGELVASELPAQTSVLRPVNSGRNNSEMLPEHAAEVRRTRKAPRKCDVRDGFSGLGLKLLAAVLQPCIPDVIADGGAPVAEQHVQIALGAVQCRRDLLD